jgi:benzil reductase ((S)-benzoin forming)
LFAGFFPKFVKNELMEKIVIVTGGSRGIGLGLANEFHNHGFRVISIARTVLQKKYEFEQYACDLTDPKAMDSTFKKLFDRLDRNNTSKMYLINNAGYLGTVNTLENLEADDISYTVRLNLVAPLILSSMFIKLSTGWKCEKKIINISSGAAVTPYESWSMYCSTKAGLDMMTRVIAKEQNELDYGVNAVSIYPGIVDTDMQTAARTTPKEHFKAVQRFIDFHKHGQLASPEEVAAKIYQLNESGTLKNGSILDVRDF